MDVGGDAAGVDGGGTGELDVLAQHVDGVDPASEGFQAYGRDVAMQVAAASPVSANRESVPAEVVEHEMGIYKAQAAESGKPEAIQEKIATGRMEKFYKENCLTAVSYTHLELLGAIVALEALKRPCHVTLYSDSQYLVNAFNQHWVDGWLKRGWKNSQKQPVKNSDLWKRMLKAKEPHDVEFVWVKGHAGHAENERCDALATSAADDSSRHKEDAGFRG